jgi:lysophospholipase L1-like esterase
MKKWICSMVVLCVVIASHAQPFRKEINDFLKADSIAAPAKGQILFVGSSSFTFWKDVQSYFPEHTILNRGFGGSSLPDVIRYAQEVIIPYRPKQIVIYCGENDFAVTNPPPVDTVLARFKTLYTIIRKELGNIPIAFVSIKPSPSRWNLEDRFVEANKQIKAFLATQPASTYVDVHTAMLLPDGNVDPSLFIGDRLHMNPSGYAIWKRILAPVLLK